nr:ribonuclease H-like domain-containing protein [Tanacetum cinerariifolium]
QKPVLKNVEKGTGQREVRPVLNNTMRINHQNFLNSKRNFTPTEVLTKSGIVPINTARQSSSRSAAPVSAARPINTTTPKPLVNVTKPKQNALLKSHSLSRRPFYHQTTLKNRILNNKINSAKHARFRDLKLRYKIMSPNVVDHTFGDLQDALKDQGYFNNGCSMHMTGNISYLTNFKEHDEWYVAFGGGAKGGKITGKGTIKTGIQREYGMARTTQQNKVAKRRNKTLIEAARTMLADSKLPTTFWTEAFNTACYVQNRVLVVKPHFKTPYELFRGTNSNDFTGKGARFGAGQSSLETGPSQDYILMPLWKDSSLFDSSSQDLDDEAIHKDGVTVWKGGMDTGGSPRCQETIGGTPAQTRSKRVLEQPNKQPLSEGHTSGSREGRMEHTFELTDIVPPIPHDSPLIGGYTPGRDEGRLKLLELMNTCTTLSNKVTTLETELSSTKALYHKAFITLTKRVKKLETQLKQKRSRAVIHSSDEEEPKSSKKQKLDEQTEEKIKAQADTDQEVEEMKLYVKIVPDEDITIDAIPLATKPPVIVEYKIVKEGKISTYHIIRPDGSTK